MMGSCLGWYVEMGCDWYDVDGAAGCGWYDGGSMMSISVSRFISSVIKFADWGVRWYPSTVRACEYGRSVRISAVLMRLSLMLLCFSISLLVSSIVVL